MAQPLRSCAVAACVAALAGGAVRAASADPFLIGTEVCVDPTDVLALQNLHNLWGTWVGVIGLGILIVFLVAGFAYMVAGLASHRGLRVWAKNQMYEGLLTIAIAIFCLGLIGFMCTADVRMFGVGCVPQTPPSWQPGVLCAGASCFNIDTKWSAPAPASPSCNPYDVAYYRLQEYRNRVNEGFMYTFGANLLVSMIASMSVDLVADNVGPSLSFGSGLSPLLSSLQTGMVAMAGLQLLNMAQIILLKVSQLLFVVLFPAGIVLRSFGVTRGFGGMLIALAIGLFIVYPSLIALVYDVFNSTYAVSLEDLKSGGTFLLEYTPASPAQAYAGMASNLSATKYFTDNLVILAMVDNDGSDGSVSAMGTDGYRYVGTRSLNVDPATDPWRVYQVNVLPGDISSLMMSALNFGSLGLFGFIQAATSNICTFFGALVLGSVFAPFAVFAIVVTFIRSLSGMLGEEIDVSNITRLV